MIGEHGLWPASLNFLSELASGEGFDEYFQRMLVGNEASYLRWKEVRSYEHHRCGRSYSLLRRAVLLHYTKVVSLFSFGLIFELGFRFWDVKIIFGDMVVKFRVQFRFSFVITKNRKNVFKYKSL